MLSICYNLGMFYRAHWVTMSPSGWGPTRSREFWDSKISDMLIGRWISESGRHLIGQKRNCRVLFPTGGTLEIHQSTFLHFILKLPTIDELKSVGPGINKISYLQNKTNQYKIITICHLTISNKTMQFEAVFYVS